MQAKRAEVFIDPSQLRLKGEFSPARPTVRTSARVCFHRKKTEEILWSIGLRSMVAHLQEEIKRPKPETGKQAGVGNLVTVSHIDSLIPLVSPAKSVIFQKNNISLSHSGDAGANHGSGALRGGTTPSAGKILFDHLSEPHMSGGASKDRDGQPLIIVEAGAMTVLLNLSVFDNTEVLIMAASAPKYSGLGSP
ncbi:hypothetical protein J5N97_024528 [Dioscorea zingiberensis]|uniref:Uncharacterized protein n=1 Tax=Dioscorea zingiberensis TaxID=325984 RepID=A0A9D5C6W7_9LILI|nr:hypothetical protein J5N97_024528 [Dioscorea zingiberensis]